MRDRMQAFDKLLDLRQPFDRAHLVEDGVRRTRGALDVAAHGGVKVGEREDVGLFGRRPSEALLLDGAAQELLCEVCVPALNAGADGGVPMRRASASPSAQSQSSMPRRSAR